MTFAGQIRDPELMDKLHGTGLDADERAHLLEQLVGPSWRERFGDSALTGAYVEWSSALRVQEVRSATVPRAEDHERMSLTALIPAWRAGLTKIVTIPSRGSFTLRLGAASLLVTAETRDDPERYSEALRSFGATLG